MTKYYPSYKDIKKASNDELKEFLKWDCRGNTYESQMKEATAFRRQIKKEALKRGLLSDEIEMSCKNCEIGPEDKSECEFANEKFVDEATGEEIDLCEYWGG